MAIAIEVSRKWLIERCLSTDPFGRPRIPPRSSRRIVCQGGAGVGRAQALRRDAAPRLIRQAVKGSGAAQARGAVQSVAAVDAATDELITVLVRAIRVFATLHAAAAVAGAQGSERRRGALAIFVALVADLSPVVAAVGALRAIAVLVTGVQTAIGE